jgi:glycerol-3-phosphate dehydrogenase
MHNFMKNALPKNPEIIICGGKFGAALTETLAKANPAKQIVFGVRNPEKAESAQKNRSLAGFFSGEIAASGNPEAAAEKLRLPENVRVMSLQDLVKIRGQVGELFIPAFPAQMMREALENLKRKITLQKECEVLSVSKGIEEATLMMMHEVIREVMGNRNQVSVLLGGNLAFDLVCGEPMIADIAGEKKDSTGKIQSLFTDSPLDIYPFQNRRQLDIAGPVKNIHSIAVGMCSMRYGKSTCAALETRGKAELERVAYIMGFEDILQNDTQRAAVAAEINKHHQAGDDLGILNIGRGIASDYALFEATRNYWAGREFVKGISAGLSPQETIRNILQQKTVEGITSAIPMNNLIQKLGIEAPIIKVVAMVLAGELNLIEAAEILQQRDWRKP